MKKVIALVLCLVMVLSMTGGADDIRRDIPAENQGKYCLLMQLLYASLLAMVYTNDLFTAYVFIEIAAITACIAVVAKESGKYDFLLIDYAPDNHIAEHVYKKLGFQPTGVFEHGEYELRLDLK